MAGTVTATLIGCQAKVCRLPIRTSLTSPLADRSSRRLGSARCERNGDQSGDRRRLGAAADPRRRGGHARRARPRAPASPARPSPSASTRCSPTSSSTRPATAPRPAAARRPCSRSTTRAGVVLAADLGATHSRLAVSDLAGNAARRGDARDRHRRGPRGGARPRSHERFAELLRARPARTAADVRGIGVGVPGPVAFAHRRGRSTRRSCPAGTRFRDPGLVRRALRRAGARRQRREHHGARRALDALARRRAPALRQGRHRHRLRDRRRPRDPPRRAGRRGRHRPHQRRRPRRRRLPLRQRRLPRGGRGRPRARAAAHRARASRRPTRRDVVALVRARRRRARCGWSARPAASLGEVLAGCVNFFNPARHRRRRRPRRGARAAARRRARGDLPALAAARHAGPAHRAEPARRPRRRHRRGDHGHRARARARGRSTARCRPPSARRSHVTQEPESSGGVASRMSFVSRGFQGRRTTDEEAARLPPGQYLTPDFPVLSAGPTPRTPLDQWSFTIQGAVDEARSWTLGRAHRAAVRDVHRRHPLRHEVDEARHDVDRRLARHAARRASRPSADYVTAWSDGGYTTNMPLEDLQRRARVDRVGVRRRAARARARRPGPAARPPPVLLEEREVGARARPHRAGRARLLGGRRLPQLRRPVAGAAVLRGLSRRRRSLWRPATVRAVVEETPRARTLVLDVPDWPGHRAGQHLDLRLTAEDGYQAQRSYSISSAPELGDGRGDGGARRRRRGLAVPRRGGAAGRRDRGPRADRRALHVVGRRGRAAAARRRRLGAGAADGDAPPPRGAGQRRRRRGCCVSARTAEDAALRATSSARSSRATA